MAKSSVKAFGNIVEHAGTGMKMQEVTARRIEEMAKSSNLPKDFGYRRLAKAASEFTCDPGSRTDISTITTDGVDRDGEVVLPQGGDWSQYNKIVTFAHQYDQLPVGSNWWIKAKVGGHGLIGKTHYPLKPADWGDSPWIPSAVLHLMQQPVPACTGKSIGFLPLNVRSATPQEKAMRPEWAGAPIIDKWAGVEYAVAPVPCQPDAEMEAVSKGMKDGIFDTKLAELVEKSYAAYSEKSKTNFIPHLRVISEHGPVTLNDVARLLNMVAHKAAAAIKYLLGQDYIREEKTGFVATEKGWNALAAAADPQSPMVIGSKAITRVEGVMTAAQVCKGFTQPGDAPQPLTRTYTQYIESGDTFEPIGDVTLNLALDQFAYRIVRTFSGVGFTKMQCQTDELYYFENSAMNDALTEIDKFWELKPDYDKLKLMHNRGIMLHGPPGMGKTSVMHQVGKMIVDRGDVVFYATRISTLIDGLSAFREVEPDRKVVVVLEDADEYAGYEEREFLQLLDGEQSISGVLYLASTNYIESFPPRLLRPGRFDKKIFVGPPPIAGRKAYLSKKLAGMEKDTEIDRLAKETDGMSFGDLRELITAVYALKEPVDSVLARLKGRNTSKRGKTMDIQPDVKANQSEMNNTTGGDILGAETPTDDQPTVPPCPKCLSADMVKLVPPEPGSTVPCAQYNCMKCGTNFEEMKDDDGGGDDMGMMSATPAATKDLELNTGGGTTGQGDADEVVECPTCHDAATKAGTIVIPGLGECDTFACAKCNMTFIDPKWIAPPANEVGNTTGSGNQTFRPPITGASVSETTVKETPVVEVKVEEQPAPVVVEVKKAVEPFYTEETIKKAIEKAKQKKADEIIAALDPIIQETLARRLGRV